MRLKDLFTVPDGQKVTEKHLRRVLVSSICSILLCMSCLAGSTWAWFTVSIVNSGNVIEIASVTPTVTITVGEEIVAASEDGSYSLTKGTYSVTVDLTKDVTASDEFGVTSRPVYLVISVIRWDSTPESYCITVEYNHNPVTHELTIGDTSVDISFAVSWVKPAAATLFEEESFVIGEISTEAPTETPTESPTEQSTQTPTETPTEQPTEAPTETPTEPEEETTLPAEDVRDPPTEAEST